MPKLQNKNLKFSLSNIVSLYLEHEDISDPKDYGTYESYDILMQVGDIKIIDNKFELCEGNILYMLSEIDEILNSEEDTVSIKFLEPDFEFIIRKYKYEYDKEEHYDFQVWANEDIWNKNGYGVDGIGLRFLLSREELEKFYVDLGQEYKNRIKIRYEGELPRA
jgi:hypothetical protein